MPAGAVPTAGTSDLIAGSLPPVQKEPHPSAGSPPRDRIMADAWRRVPEVLHWAVAASVDGRSLAMMGAVNRSMRRWAHEEALWSALVGSHDQAALRRAARPIARLELEEHLLEAYQEETLRLVVIGAAPGAAAAGAAASMSTSLSVPILCNTASKTLSRRGRRAITKVEWEGVMMRSRARMFPAWIRRSMFGRPLASAAPLRRGAARRAQSRRRNYGKK